MLIINSQRKKGDLDLGQKIIIIKRKRNLDTLLGLKNIVEKAKVPHLKNDTQNNMMPKLLVGQYSDWHNGYFIAVCEKFG